MTKIKFLVLTTMFFIMFAGVNAQYYYPNNYYNYASGYNSNSGNYYGYGNNPNNGVVSFVGDQNYYNYGNYSNGYYGGTYYNNYVQPVSVSVPNSNYYPYNYNYNNLTYYNNSTLLPSTYAATNVGQSNATINGYVTVSGNSYNNSYGTTWFQYGINQSSLNWSTSPANVNGTTNTNAYLTGLNCGTTYYFRAVTSGQNSMQYGNVLAFTTAQCNYGYNGYYGNYYPNYNYQAWQAPQINTYCYKPVKKIKRYYW